MKKKISQRKQFISEHKIDLEKRILPSVALVGMIISFVGFFVNLPMHLGPKVSIVAALSFFLFTFCYFISKIEKYRGVAKWFLMVITFIIINFLWYYNNGSRGPALYLFVIVYSFFIFVFSKKGATILSILAIVNVLTLFYLEYKNPDIVGNYASAKDQVLDVYTALVYYSFIFYVFMSIVREAYFFEYKKAKRADRLKSSFLANMSHEIRTPLNAIVGFSNILADENLTQLEREQYATIINGSNDSLLRLVNDILDVSMIESDQLSVVLNECNVGVLMDNLVETYSLKMNQNSRIQLKNKRESGQIFVKTDETRLKQVMINLLDNAVKYTEDGKIEFGLSVEENELKFFVKDTGIGIKDSHMNYLFDRFYKVEDDTSKLFRGTGIGLYLSKRIVELLGGNIWVESEYGKGSEFYFTIPKSDFRMEDSVKQYGKKLTALHANGRRLKVLIIEDQESNQQYYTALLKPSNFELVQAYNGMEGIEAFNNNPDADLILLDLKMPDIDGFDVLSEIRKKDTEIPIIAQTAYAMSTDREKCLEAGFSDYIAKPIGKEAMFRLIKKHVPQVKTL